MTLTRAAAGDEAGMFFVDRDDAVHARTASHVTVSEDGRDGIAAFNALETQEHEPVHPHAQKLFAKVPFLRWIPIFGPAASAYGPVCILSMAVVQACSKGVADQLLQLSVQPMYTYRFHQKDSNIMQRAVNVMFLGFSVKAFPALFSDTFAIVQYKKRWYTSAAAILAAVFALAYAVLPQHPSSASPAAGFLFLSSLGKAVIDVLTEGHYSRLMRRRPAEGPALVSFLWIFILAGTVIAAALSGPLNDAGDPRVAVFISMSLMFVIVPILALNGYQEEKNREEQLEDAMVMRALEKARLAREAAQPISGDGAVVWEAAPKDYEPEAEAAGHAGGDDERAIVGLSGEPIDGERGDVVEFSEDDEDFAQPKVLCCGLVEMNVEVVYRNWKAYILAVALIIGIAGNCAATIVGNALENLIVNLAVSVVLCTGCFFTLPLTIAKANLYSFLQFAAYLQFAQPMRSFYVASEVCVPGGPNFSFTFYDTVGLVIGNSIGIVACLIFPYVFSKRSYRFVVICTSLLQVISSIFDLIILERWNRPKVSDHVVYVLGDAVVYQMCYMVYFLPLTVLMSRLCPRGSESVVYALLSGMANFGQSVANSIASVLLDRLWPVWDLGPGLCNFHNLRWMLITGHFVTPLLILPLVFILLPGARICDRIDVNGKAVTEEEYQEKFGGADDAAIQAAMRARERRLQAGTEASRNEQ